ncbi:GPI transamidase component [Varicellaria rhodocarpa]|nr:GPI transamidase component [Varicellaria rhodocarpa]
MATEDIVTDPFLRSMLDASTHTLQQCIILLELADINALPATSSSFQNTLLVISKQQKLLQSHLGQLRGYNRNALLTARDAKQITAEARQEIDRLHLQLQNLYYEQRHLRGEITACESYDHKYQQLPLIPTKEFLLHCPEHREATESELMIARINHEHAEREALEQARQGLLKKKQGLIADNKKRKDDLASLDKDLEKFIDAAKPIQKIFEKEY